VLSLDDNTDRVKITFFHPCGLSPPFVHPLCSDILNISHTLLRQMDSGSTVGLTLILSSNDDLL
jgi:hypothetical protein